MLLRATILCLPLCAVAGAAAPAHGAFPGSNGRIVFEVAEQDPAPPTSDFISFTNSIHIVDPDGSGARTLVRPRKFCDVGGPAIGPGGLRLAYTRDCGSRKIVLASLHGGGRKRLVSGFSPAWGPSGGRLAFQATTGYHALDGIQVVGTDGRGLRRVAQGSRVRSADTVVRRDNSQPAWSSRGQIAFVRVTETSRYDEEVDAFAVEETVTEIRRIRPSGRGDALVLRLRCGDSAEECEVGSLDWSPDGRSLAYTLDGEAYRVAADGSGRRKLTPGRGHLHSAAWSPDGRSLALAGRALFRVRAAGGPAERILRPRGIAVSVAWQPLRR